MPLRSSLLITVSLGLASLSAVSFLEAAPVISEFLASPREGIDLDDDGEESDWIEIYNPSGAPVNLEGYALSDVEGERSWVFPSVNLEAGGYLVVWASGKNRRDEAGPLHTDFKLDRSGEYLELSDPEGGVLSAFAPEYPGQERGIAYGLAVMSGAEYAFFPEPTPGKANGSPPPVIEGTDFFPKPAVAEERLTVTATVRSTGAPIQEVRLLSRVMFKNEVRGLMLDDGVAPDEVAGDGVYTGQISNRTLFGLVFHPGEAVRWAIEAEDAAGQVARYPAHATEESEAYTGTVLQTEPVDTQLEIFQWFVEDPRQAETDRGAECVCVFRGEFYDNCFVRVRGGTARSWPKKSFKIEFPEDHHLKFDPDLPRVDEFNLNATYTDKSYVRAMLTTELHQDSGTPSPIIFPLRVHQNGAFYSVAHFVEQCDRDFLRRNDLDPDGAYYKANPGSEYVGVGSFEKKTRREEGKEDVTAFIEGLRLRGQELEVFLMDHVDLPAQLNFMAGVAVTQNIDDSNKNHFLYRDTEGRGEWFMTPWDLDLTFGPDALNTDVIIADEERRGAVNPNAVHPFIGSHKFPLHAGKTNELLDRLFTTARTRDMYLRRLRTLHDRFLATDYFDRRLDALVALMEKDTIEDRERWGNQSHFPGRRDGMAETVERIKEEYLVPRRAFFERGGLVGIPESMPEDVTLEFGEVVFSPGSGRQDEEYIELRNPNGYAVDLSGWRLEGGVEHTFRPGTVLLSGSLFAPGRNLLYVVKDTVAFRSRTDGPTGGMGLWVQGDYEGSLSGWGEELRLVDAAGRVAASMRYEGAPSVWQRDLRITEILPQAGEGGTEFIELQNVGSEALDLTGVRFTEGVDFAFPAGTSLAPGAYILVVRERSAMEALYGAELPIAGEFAGGTRLDNGGEALKLEDPENNTIAAFRYGTEAPWPAVTAGHSYVFLGTEAREVEDGGKWGMSVAAGGAPNAPDDGAPGGGGGRELLTVAFGTLQPAGVLHRKEGGAMEIVYPVLSAEGIDFTLETSADLQGWTTLDIPAEVTESHLLRFQLPRQGGEGYLRVRVRSAESP